MKIIREHYKHYNEEKATLNTAVEDRRPVHRTVTHTAVQLPFSLRETVTAISNQELLDRTDIWRNVTI